jgi:CoA-transferase family III
LALSFADAAGVEILHKLAASSDVLVENYLPGTLKKYQMDYDTIHKLNPRYITNYPPLLLHLHLFPNPSTHPTQLTTISPKTPA